MNLISVILTALLLAAPGGVTFDSVSHDFGSQPKTVSYLEHVYRFTNDTGKAVKVSYAVATCSCTHLSWTTGSVAPGAEGFVKAVYHRESNVNSFEKFISVFFEGSSKPVVLRIAGSFHETRGGLSKEFPVSRGPLGFAYSPIRYGNAVRGTLASDAFWVANLSDAPVRLDFTSFSDSLDVYPSEIVIQPNDRQRFGYTIKLDTGSWGLRRYTATPVINGVPAEPVTFTLVAVEDYSSLSGSEKNAAPRPILVDRDCSFGTVRHGRPAKAVFKIRNSSNDLPLNIRAVFSEDAGMDIAAPSSIAPGATADFKVSLPSSSLVKGKNAFKVCVQSDSPLRQILEVYVSGIVE